jgi:threonine/homoserine/homoserine lactone efflux protein
MIGLGYVMLRDSFRHRGEDSVEAATLTESEASAASGESGIAGPDSRTGPRPGARFGSGSVLASWGRGVSTNLLNPKVGVFYVAMLPQFIPQHASHLLMGVLLAGVHDVEALAWFSLLIFASGFARTWLRSRRAHNAIDRVTGGVLIGFGLELALSEH